VAQHLYNSLQAFYRAHPKFAKRPLYVTGEVRALGEEGALAGGGRGGRGAPGGGGWLTPSLQSARSTRLVRWGALQHLRAPLCSQGFLGPTRRRAGAAIGGRTSAGGCWAVQGRRPSPPPSPSLPPSPPPSPPKSYAGKYVPSAAHFILQAHAMAHGYAHKLSKQRA
jgi:hypothetical protein